MAPKSTAGTSMDDLKSALGLDPKAMKEISRETEKTSKATKEWKNAATGVGKQIKGIGSAMSNLRKETLGFVSTLTGVNWDISLKGIISHVDQMSRFTTTMNKATGAAGKMSGALREHRKAAKGLAVGMEELTQHHTKMRLGMVDFTKLSKKAQGELGGLASGLDKVGIAVEDTAKNLDIMTKGLGMTWQEAKKTQTDIAKMAISMGVAPAKMAKDFQSAAPKLAAYGKAAWSEFKKLAAQAKATGLEMSTLLGITEKFDTFEGAAEQTAQLNAIMGTTLNSVDLLMASEADRIKIIKQGIDATGKSWESMGRFEKKALAQAAGLKDVEEAARMFGTSMKDIADAEAAADPALVSQEALNKAMRQGVDRASAFKAMLEGVHSRFADLMMPLVNDFVKFFIREALPKLEQSITWMKVQVGLLSKKFADMGINMEPLKKAAAWGIALAIALGPVLAALGMIVGVLFALKVVAAAVLAAFSFSLIPIAAAVYLLYDNWELVKQSVQLFWEDTLKPFISGFRESWGMLWGDVKAVWVDTWHTIEDEFVSVMDLFGMHTKGTQKNWKETGKMVGNVVGSIVSAVGTMAKFVAKSFGSFLRLIMRVKDGIGALFGGDTKLAMRFFKQGLAEFILRPIAGLMDMILTIPWMKQKAVGWGWLEAGDTAVGAVERQFGLQSAEQKRAIGDNMRRQKQEAAERSYAHEIARWNATQTSGGVRPTVPTPSAPTATTPASAVASISSQTQGRQETPVLFVLKIDGREFVRKVVRPHLEGEYVLA